MRSWVGTLIEKGILVTQGIKKGTEYLLNPALFAHAKLDLKPSLKTIEPYKLEALIIEDLKYNGKSSRQEIHNRLKEISENEIQKAIYRMVEQAEIVPEGGKKNRTYTLSKKK